MSLACSTTPSDELVSPIRNVPGCWSVLLIVTVMVAAIGLVPPSLSVAVTLMVYVPAVAKGCTAATLAEGPLIRLWLPSPQLIAYVKLDPMSADDGSFAARLKLSGCVVTPATAPVIDAVGAT